MAQVVHFSVRAWMTMWWVEHCASNLQRITLKRPGGIHLSFTAKSPVYVFSMK